jgi:hypothetical protein
MNYLSAQVDELKRLLEGLSESAFWCQTEIDAFKHQLMQRRKRRRPWWRRAIRWLTRPQY